MKTLITLLFFTLITSISASAATKKSISKLKINEIKRILKVQRNGVVSVQTKSGKKFNVKLNKKQLVLLRKKLRKKKRKTRTISKPASRISRSKISLKNAVKNKKKSPWGSSLFNYTASNVKKLHEGVGETSMYWRYTIQYNTDSKFAYKLRPVVEVNYDHEGTAATHNLGDWVLEIEKLDLKFAGFTTSPFVRYHLPTGVGSREQDSAGMLQFTSILKKQINPKFSIAYAPQIKYYLNSKASNVTFDEFDRVSNVPTGNTSLRYQHAVVFEEKIHPNFALGQYIELDHRFKYSDPEVGLTESQTTTELEWELSATYSGIDWLSLTLAIANKDQLGGDDGFSLISAETMAYKFIGNIVFF